MSPARRLIRALCCDGRGTAVIETALVLPILCLLTVGAFDVSRLVARNTELRSALAESAAIALAHAPEDQAQIDAIEDIVEASTALSDDQVTMASRYRCGSAAALVDAETACPSGSIVSRYLEITLGDTYTPHWTSFGIGSPVTLSITRTVQIG